MSLFRPGDRIYVPENSDGIDHQFLGKCGTIIGTSTSYSKGQHYNVQFDEVEPPFHPRPYGPKNYWKVHQDNMEPTAPIQLTPEGIEAFLNA